MYVCMYVCMYVYIYVCIYVYMYICIYVYMYICIYVYMYICIYVYMYICIYLCWYIFIYTHSLSVWNIYNTATYIIYHPLTDTSSGHHIFHANFGTCNISRSLVNYYRSAEDRNLSGRQVCWKIIHYALIIGCEAFYLVSFEYYWFISVWTGLYCVSCRSVLRWCEHDHRSFFWRGGFSRGVREVGRIFLI